MNTHDTTISNALCGRVLRAATVYELEPPSNLADERLVNGDFDSWATSTDANNWTEIGVPTNGTITQETSVVRSGSALRITKTSTSEVVVIQAVTVKPSKWYSLTFYYQRGSGPILNKNLQVLLYNSRTNVSWDQATQTWTAPNTNIVYDGTEAPVGEWLRAVIWFQYDPDARSTDKMNLRIGDFTGNGGSWYIDDASLMGPYDRPALYYASRAITWNGITYTAQVLKASQARDTMKLVQSRFQMEIANALRPLRAYLDPVDTFTGGVLRCRIVFMDSSFVVDDTRSFVYWRGVMQQPTRGGDKSITLRAVGKINPRKVPSPSRRLSERCQVRRFADGVECNYTSTDTAANAGVDSTALVIPAPPPVYASRTLEVGQAITIGNGDPVLIASSSVPNITLAEPRTWALNDPIRYASCDRTWSSCDLRNRQHEFQGFRAARVSNFKPRWDWIEEELLNFGNADQAQQLIDYANNYVPGGIVNSELQTSPDDVLPVIIGRRWTKGSTVETVVSATGEALNRMDCRFVALSEGEINSIREVVAGDERFEHTIDPDDSQAVIQGWYWRPGTIGVVGDETVAAYQATPLVQQRAQNTDHRTSTATAMSRTAYAVLLVAEDADNQNVDSASFDVEGMKLQKYLANGSLDGSPVFTANPLWACVLFATSRRFALDMSPDDLDFAVIKTEAEYCDELLTSVMATSETGTATNQTASNSGSNSTNLIVSGPLPTHVDGTLIQIGTSNPVRILSGAGTVSIQLEEERTWSAGNAIKRAAVWTYNAEGFVRGQLVDVGDDTSQTIYRVIDTNVFELETPIDYTAGEVVQGYYPRFEIAYELKRKQSDAMAVLKNIFTACRGYATQDHHAGKVQFRIERGHVTNILSNGSLDDWTADAPDSWTEVNSGVGSSIITEETSIVRTAGGSSCKFEKTSAHTMHIVQNRTGLEPLSWYLISFWVYVSRSARAVGVRIENSDAGTYWEARPGVYPGDVPSWETSTGTGERTFQWDVTTTNTWLKVTMPFHIPEETFYDAAASYALRIYQDFPTSPNVNGNLYVDDVKLEGPLAGFYRDSDELEPLDVDTTSGDGALDEWTGNVPDGWGTSEGNGTVRKESGIVHTAGGSSAKVTRTSSSGNLWVARSFVFLPGRTYRASYWQYIASGGTGTWAANNPKLQFLWYDGGFSSGTIYTYQLDGTWNLGASSFTTGDGTEDRWTLCSFEFTTPSNAVASDDYSFRISAYSSATGTFYVDDVIVEGPIDRTPLTQPGQGIIEGSFKWSNDDAKRKEINQVSCNFMSQANTGKRDEIIEDDFEDQTLRGYAKRGTIKSDAIGNPDLASRLAQTSLLKAQQLGPGCTFKSGWHGLTVQPGEIIAIRHENPAWNGELFRVTKREAAGLGSGEFISTLTVEDYDASVYPDATTPRSFGLDFTNAGLTLTADTIDVAGQAVGSVRGVALSWAWTGAQIGVGQYKLHASPNAGFTPSATTLITTTSTRSYVYRPATSDIGSVVYFRVVANGAGTWRSSEASALITEVTVNDIDPGSTDDTMPFNLVYDGDFNDPANWSGNGSTVTSNVPATDDSVSTTAAASFAARPDAYDGSTTTRSTGAVSFVSSTSTFNQCEGNWSWESATPDTKSGKLVAIVSMTHATGDGVVTCLYSTNAGGVYSTFAQYSPTASTGTLKVTLDIDLFDIAIEDLRVRIVGSPGFEFQTDSSQTVSLWETRFVENTAITILASVGGGVASLQKVSGTVDAKVFRKFPGSDSGPQYLMSTGDTYVVRLRAKRISGLLTDDVRVVLVDNNDGSSITLMTIPASDITTTSQEFAALFTSASELVGLYDIQVETGSSQPVEVDRLSVQEGTQITEAVTSVEEQLAGTFVDKQAGATGNFEPGPWVGTNVKKASIT